MKQRLMGVLQVKALSCGVAIHAGKRNEDQNNAPKGMSQMISFSVGSLKARAYHSSHISPYQTSYWWVDQAKKSGGISAPACTSLERLKKLESMMHCGCLRPPPAGPRFR